MSSESTVGAPFFVLVFIFALRLAIRSLSGLGVVCCGSPAGLVNAALLIGQDQCDDLLGCDRLIVLVVKYGLES